MKTALYVLPVLAIMVFFLVRAEFRTAQRQIYVIKPLATLLVIAAALLSFCEARVNLTYTVGALVGLALSFGGDIALMFQANRKAFMIGLVLFLLAHVAYAVTFTLLAGLDANVWLAALALAALGVGIYRLFRSGLGTMKVPVIVYSDVILAANRFWKPFQYNRISLAFYYAGQFLIALAASYFV